MRSFLNFEASWLTDIALWTAGIVFLIPLKHRERFGLHILSYLGVGAAYFFALNWIGRFEFPFGFLIDLLSVLIIWRLIYLCCDIQKRPAAYVSIWSMVIPQLYYTIWWLTAQVYPELSYIWVLLIWLFIGSVIMYLSLARFMPVKKTYIIGPRQMVSSIILLLLFELLFWKYPSKVTNRETFFGAVVIIMAQLFCITVLYFQHEMFKKSAIQQELTMTNMLWHQQHDQYQLSKENIELINQKCHDIKHQIAAMRMITSSDDRNRYIDELENSIKIYDGIVKTGNEVLDILLTEKSLYCQANYISIHCVVDGKLLNFLDPIDLYTIFGNALDNAIEGVEKIKQKDSRQIDVLVYQRQQYLVVNISNPMGSFIDLKENQLPETTKKQKDFHGFGLKSIRSTAKKYEGIMSVSTEKALFSLKILFPIRLV